MWYCCSCRFEFDCCINNLCVLFYKIHENFSTFCTYIFVAENCYLSLIWVNVHGINMKRNDILFTILHLEDAVRPFIIRREYLWLIFDHDQEFWKKRHWYSVIENIYYFKTYQAFHTFVHLWYLCLWGYAHCHSWFDVEIWGLYIFSPVHQLWAQNPPYAHLSDFPFHAYKSNINIQRTLYVVTLLVFLLKN